MTRIGKRNGGSASRATLVAAIRAVTDTASEDAHAKPPHRRRTGADARAAWSPTDRIVFEPEREGITGYKRNSWWKKEQKGEVPKRIKLGERRVGWLLSELEAWVRERAAMRDAEVGGDDARAA